MGAKSRIPWQAWAPYHRGELEDESSRNWSDFGRLREFVRRTTPQPPYDCAFSRYLPDMAHFALRSYADNSVMRKLTIRDVAKQESVSERTVLNWVDRGVLTPAYQVGKIIRFSEEGVRRDLKSANTANQKEKAEA